MKTLLLSLLLIPFLVACANTAVIRQVDDSKMCGEGITRLLPNEGEVWLVLCEDGRVLWMVEDNEDLATQ